MNDLVARLAYLCRMRQGAALAQCSGCRIGSTPFAARVTTFVMAGSLASALPARAFLSKTTVFCGGPAHAGGKAGSLRAKNVKFWQVFAGGRPRLWWAAGARCSAPSIPSDKRIDSDIMKEKADRSVG